jgi:hypothetical protein
MARCCSSVDRRIRYVDVIIVLFMSHILLLMVKDRCSQNGRGNGSEIVVLLVDGDGRAFLHMLKGPGRGYTST